MLNKEILEILRELKEGQNRLETKFDGLEAKVDGLQIQTEENTQILRAIDERTKVISAEQENMKNDIVHIQGDIKAIKNDLAYVEQATARNWSDIAKLKRP
jgi:chromosome segregation ATPase